MIEVGIVDLGLGNIRSLSNAFEVLEAKVRVVAKPAELSGVDRLVLPGVGAFGDGMEALVKGDWGPALDELVHHRKIPILGICLGMQLLASLGTEFGERPGLGWLPGKVVKLLPEGELRVPHVGWNDVAFKSSSRLGLGLEPSPTFYFVHSYVFECNEAASVSGTTDYGRTFASVVERDNIFGVQFHPEKSHKAGLALLSNYLKAN